MSKLKYAYVASSDVERAVGFYEQVLGLTLKFRDGERWAQFSAQGADFAVASRGEAVADTVAVFEVQDLDAVAAKVVAAGGRLGLLRDMGAHGRVLTLHDPDGNVLQLYAKAAKPMQMDDEAPADLGAS